MQKQANEIRYFFYSQAFADGLRTTFAILIPALLGSYFNQFDLGLTLSTGALCVSIADAPGPIIHKKNGMLICAVLILFVSALTSLARLNLYTLGLEIVLLSFFFSMFTVYGNRASAVGNACLLILIFTMDKAIPVNDIAFHSLITFGGGIWYATISLLFNRLQPYRPAERVLGDSIREVARYLSVKAAFYDPSTGLDEAYKKLVAQQIVVSEKQDAVREILFKTRQIMKESTTTGRKLVLTFVETVDLFEDITATYYDYDALRKRFGSSGILEKVSLLIHHIAQELDHIGVAIQLRAQYQPSYDFDSQLRQLKEAIDGMAKTETESNLVLKKILVNMRKLVTRFQELSLYFKVDQKRGPSRTQLDHSHFVSHQPLDPRILWNNLNLESGVFKHSIRVMVACFTGFMIVKFISSGHHSYWILLTIAFIIKPAFSLTKQRNIQRIMGTLIGGAIGMLILIFIPNTTFRFSFMVLFMLGTYSFQRINYLLMVLFVTPFVVILFSFLGVGFIEVAKERILDTVIGCAIAFSASYLLFPTWESGQFNTYLRKMLEANIAYLQKITDALHGKKSTILAYKLARKEVYVSSANLSAAFQRMLSEPKSKQRNTRLIHQFTVLNHILFSNIASIATTVQNKDLNSVKPDLALAAQRSQRILCESLALLDPHANEVKPEDKGKTITAMAEERLEDAEDVLLKDQLDYLYRLGTDIRKTIKAIL